MFKKHKDPIIHDSVIFYHVIALAIILGIKPEKLMSVVNDKEKIFEYFHKMIELQVDRVSEGLEKYKGN
jgi:hypothetical protein